MAGQYAVQISCTLNGIKQKFLLDTINETSISSSSTLSSHPIYQGDYVGDHMYREQTSISISGEYSLNAGSNLNLGTGTSKLVIFQSIFETIKNEAILCDIIKIAKGENSAGRFLKRTNMALTSIRWQEGINSLGFTFQFTQIITSKAATNATKYIGDVDQNFGEFDTTDIYLPSYAVDTYMNFASVILNYNAISSVVNDVISTTNDRTKTLNAKVKLLGANGLKSIGTNSEVASLLMKIVATYELNNCDKLFSEGFIENLNSETISQKFSGTTDIQNNNIISYADYLSTIYNKINELSNYITCYQVNSNGEQTSVILIDNIYYEFVFKRNNTNNTYYISVRNTNADNNEYATISRLCSAAPTNYSDCTIENMLFKTTNYYVHLIRLSSGNISDLTSYYIILSKVSPELFCTQLNNIINAGLDI